MEARADEVGKRLGKRRQIDLTGTKEKKLRGPGIRIIYQITERKVEILEIVEILLIDFKRNDTNIYREAEIRYQEARQLGGMDDSNRNLYWNFHPYENEVDLNQPSMIDQIFDQTFDDLSEDLKQKISDEYAHGRIESAYQIWLRGRRHQ